MNSPARISPPRVPEPRAQAFWRAAVVLAGCGAALAAAAAFVAPERLAFSYLTGFLFVLTLGLGGLAFVLLQHVTRAGWSVAVRRQAEWLAGILPFCILLFIPIALTSHSLFHEWMSAEGQRDPLVAAKAGWLNPTFFYLRGAGYLVLWALVSRWFRRASTAQDETGEPLLTTRAQRYSAPSILALGLTITLASFDWLMSLDPHWYSTIFGIYVISGTLVAGVAFVALATVSLERRGLGVATVEHRHDLGKLLFGFTVFWAYIAFSQYFLIWYANIPEEIVFYLHRWEGEWRTVSLLLVIGHFVVPFVLLMPRAGKRSLPVLGGAAVWMLFMHWVDLYWLVMPALGEAGAHVSWVDVAGLAAPAGVLALWLASRARREALWPLRDPRLAESTRLVNP